MILPPVLPALILQTSLFALLLLVGASAWWALRRARRRRIGNPLGSVRAGLRSLADRACKEGRPGHAGLVPGIRALLSPSAPPSTESVEQARKEAGRETGIEELAVFTLEDMIVSGHPMALTFYEIAGVGPEDLPPAGVSFLIAPAFLRVRLVSALSDEGLEVLGEGEDAPPAQDGDRCGERALRVRAFGQETAFSAAVLYAEAAATATPIEIIGRDEAHRLLAELSMRAARASTRRPRRRTTDSDGDGMPPAKPHRDHCLHPPSTDRSFGAWIFPVPARSGAAGAWVLVGHSISSVARQPMLLAGLSKVIEGTSPERRRRVHSYREDVLVVADFGVETALLTACRRRARLFLGGIGEPEKPPLLIDEVVELGLETAGTFELSPVDDRFFDAAAAAALARLHGDVTGATTARAMMRLSMNDLFGARAHLEEAARLAPANGEILLALGTLLNEMGDHSAAEPILRRAVGLDLENPATNNNLGVAYKGLGRLIEAQLFFEKAASIRPDDAVARVNLGRALLDSGDANAAEHSFREALQRDPASVPALTGLVLVAVREGDYGLARLRLGAALGVAPTDAGLLRLHRALNPEEQAH